MMSSELQTGDMIASGFDDCIIGVATMNNGVRRVVYSCDQMVAQLCKDGMTADEAEEYLEFNTFCAYMGPSTPIYIREFIT